MKQKIIIFLLVIFLSILSIGIYFCIFDEFSIESKTFLKKSTIKENIGNWAYGSYSNFPDYNSEYSLEIIDYDIASSGTRGAYVYISTYLEEIESPLPLINYPDRLNVVEFDVEFEKKNFGKNIYYSFKEPGAMQEILLVNAWISKNKLIKIKLNGYIEKFFNDSDLNILLERYFEVYPSTVKE